MAARSRFGAAMTAPLSDAAVRASVARAEAATPGPWTVQAENGHSAVIWARGRPETSPKLAIFYGNAKDAEFAAAARTDVVALGTEVLRLREVLEVLRELLGVAELERRKPAESPWPNASGFPDP